LNRTEERQGEKEAYVTGYCGAASLMKNIRACLDGKAVYGTGRSVPEAGGIRFFAGDGCAVAAFDT
jgi:hypothetical protein